MASKQEKIDLLRETIVTSDDLDYMNVLDEGMLDKIIREFELYKERTEKAQEPLYQAMAQVAKFLPSFLTLKIGKDYLTPYVLAQISRFLDPKQSASLGKGFDASLLAEVALHADLELSAKIADKMGVNEVHKITSAMINVGYFGKLGEMSDHLSRNMLSGLIPKISDNQHMAKIAYHMQADDQLHHVLHALPSHRLDQIKSYLKEMGECPAMAVFEGA